VRQFLVRIGEKARRLSKTKLEQLGACSRPTTSYACSKILIIGLINAETAIVIIIVNCAVGSGSAGSAVAGRLSEVPEWDVLVLEAGGQPPAFAKIPGLNFGAEFPNSSYTYEYKTPPQKYSTRFRINHVRIIRVKHSCGCFISDKLLHL
jgi:hypothetical protein